MYVKRQVFCFTLIVLLKPSTTYEYEEYVENTSGDSEEELRTTPQPPPKIVEVAEAVTVYETTQIFADKGSDVVLKCSPEHGKATWLLTPSRDLSITATSDGTSSLTITNLTNDRTCECRRSDNIVKRFVLSVNGPYATIVSDSSDFVRNGTNIRLSCVVRSILPVTSAYLRADDSSQKYITNWESKRRICENNDYNRTDCAEETTFQFNVDVTDNAIYFCGWENVESLGHSVEVLNNEPVIYEATKVCYLPYVQRMIVQYATEALEKHGFSQDAASDIRKKCIAVYLRDVMDGIASSEDKTTNIPCLQAITVYNMDYLGFRLDQYSLLFFEPLFKCGSIGSVNGTEIR